VAAFRSTLQETRDADLLLHVVDAADERRQGNIEQVNQVLAEIGAERQPVLLVYNKIDQLPNGAARIERDEQGRPVPPAGCTPACTRWAWSTTSVPPRMAAGI